MLAVWENLQVIGHAADKSSIQGERTVRGDSGHAPPLRAVRRQSGDHLRARLRFNEAAIAPVGDELTMQQRTRAKGGGLSWFVRRGGSVRGPFSSTRVRHLVLEGRLQFDDEVSTDRSSWRHLGSVDEVVPLQLRADGASLAEVGEGERRRERRGALRSILVASLIVAVLIAAVMLAGRRQVDEGRDCGAPPMPGVILEGCQLAGAQMATASLAGARLANAWLGGATFAEADLSGADLRYADLSRADLSYARLSTANLKGANLRFADLTNADLRDAGLDFADLSHARLGGARLDGASLNGTVWIDGRACSAADCPR